MPVRPFPTLGAGTVRAGRPGRQGLDQLADRLRLGDRSPATAFSRARPVRGAARPARGRRRSARSRSSRCRRAGRPGLRDGRRSDLREPAPYERSRRVSQMLTRNWLPGPSPRWAPATSPAMSWNRRTSAPRSALSTMPAISEAVVGAPSIGGRRRSTASSANVGDRRSERIGVGQCAADVSDTRRTRRSKSLPRPAAVLSVCGTLLVGDEHGRVQRALHNSPVV